MVMFWSILRIKSAPRPVIGTVWGVSAARLVPQALVTEKSPASAPVSLTLAGQRVRVERVQTKLLVSYRHMYIREPDSESGSTRPLVVARPESVDQEPKV